VHLFLWGQCQPALNLLEIPRVHFRQVPLLQYFSRILEERWQDRIPVAR
jgi:hypothetical protein